VTEDYKTVRINLDDPNSWRGVPKDCLAAKLRKIPRYDWTNDPKGYKIDGLFPSDRCLRCGSRCIQTGVNAFCADCDRAMEMGSGSSCMFGQKLDTLIDQKARIPEREVITQKFKDFERADQLR